MTPYLQKQALYPPFIYKKASANLGIVVVIPAYKEEFLLLSLMSLRKCQLPLCDVEVIVVINDGEKDSKKTKALNQKTYQQALDWSKTNSESRMRFRILYKEDIPTKVAGVGMARKIGMDEACYRFEQRRIKRGIIVCFDADSRCQENYLVALEEHFKKHPRTPACSIHFEHPLMGYDFDEKIYVAIAAYELHLRYFIHAQKFAGCPYAFQTIGSSMAVRSDHYQQQGGMNRRKAGEDFYFLHKFIALDNFTELITTTVIPSPRVSDRVPFGTGKAVGEIKKLKGQYATYNPLTFIDLQIFLSQLKVIFKTEKDWKEIALPLSIKSFLAQNDFSERLAEIKKNTTNFPSFRKRFFQWFNAFQVMKYAHFARDNYYENVPVEEAANWLLTELQIPDVPKNGKEMLLIFRALDKKEEGNHTDR